MHFVYPAKIERDEAGAYLVTFPDVPEAVTDGRDPTEAMTEAADALTTALAGYVHARRPLPKPSRIKGARLVAVPGLVAAKLALYDAMHAQGINTAAQLADRLGKSETVTRRLLDPEHASKWESVENALAEFGLRATVTVEAA